MQAATGRSHCSQYMCRMQYAGCRPGNVKMSKLISSALAALSKELLAMDQGEQADDMLGC